MTVGMPTLPPPGHKPIRPLTRSERASGQKAEDSLRSNMNVKDMEENQGGRQPNGAGKGNYKHFAPGQRFEGCFHGQIARQASTAERLPTTQPPPAASPCFRDNNSPITGSTAFVASSR